MVGRRQVARGFGPAAALAMAAVLVAASGPPASITDLGTLGGDWSRGLGVNDRGQVVGASQVPPGRLHAISAHAFLWENGRMRDLGTLGGTESVARDVNERGQVVGVSDVLLDDEGRRVEPRPRHFPPDRRFPSDFHKISAHAFLWDGGRMRDLGTLGGDGSEAHAINERGDVVGRSQISPGRLHRTDRHAFLWRDGRMVDLGTLRGDESVAFDVNDRRQVVGASQTGPGRDKRVEVHAFLWEDGQMRDLGTLGGRNSRAYGINDRGQVVGESETRDGETHAFLWEDGRMVDLGTLGGGSSVAHDINDAGRVVGASATGGGGVHAFVWESGTMRDLSGLNGESRAFAVADDGTVVGTSRTRRDRLGRVSIHAVQWTDRGGLTARAGSGARSPGSPAAPRAGACTTGTTPRRS